MSAPEGQNTLLSAQDVICPMCQHPVPKGKQHVCRGNGQPSEFAKRGHELLEAYLAAPADEKAQAIHALFLHLNPKSKSADYDARQRQTGEPL